MEEAKSKIAKTVYILGAGFSKECGAPLQSEIITKMLELPSVKSLKPEQKRKVVGLVRRFTDFCNENMLTSEGSVSKIALEDIFTPLDRCISDDISFREVAPNELIRIREDIYVLIAAAISQSIKNPQKPYIIQFADYLIKKAKIRVEEPKQDNISVISTNWDIILDNALQTKLNMLKKTDEDYAGVVDYCCYMSSLYEDEKIKPGLYALGKGKFNVKLLKLHGSMNWLTCPRCQRLYVNFYDKFQGMYLIKEHHCSHCKNNFKGAMDKSFKLRTNLIMPTFLKDLNNFQLKLIWQNAGIEFSEASEVVFIGYSLPYADFELRQLLSRMLRKDVKIRVVLSKWDKPVKGFEWASPAYRYESFFDKANLKITYEGAENYVLKDLSKGKKQK